jgi:hypothetical protein
MVLIKAVVPRSFDLILAGDVHVGTKMCHRSGVEWLVKNLRKHNTYMVFMGDAIDGITNTDKRWDLEAFDGSTPLQQAKEIVAMFKPVRKRILAWLVGNHERTIKGFGNVVRDKICDDLSVPYGTVSCRITFIEKKDFIVTERFTPLFRGFFHHGDGTIDSSHPDPWVRKSMMTYKLKTKLEPFGGDCILNAMGHTHKMLVYKPVDDIYLTQKGNDIKARYTSDISAHVDENGDTVNYINPYKRWYVNTGGFEKLYSHEATSGYAEVAMYDPLELGYVVVEVRDGAIANIRKVYV